MQNKRKRFKERTEAELSKCYSNEVKSLDNFDGVIRSTLVPIGWSPRPETLNSRQPTFSDFTQPLIVAQTDEYHQFIFP